MRRLLCLALALVLLALTGLMFVRVTTSPAYLARSLTQRFRSGMTRDEVREIMASIHTTDSKFIDGTNSPGGSDDWRLDREYCVIVYYDPPQGSELVDLRCQTVRSVYITKEAKSSLLDDFLEFIGYPTAISYH